MKYIFAEMPSWMKVGICLLFFGLVRLPVENTLRRQLTESRMILPLPGKTGIEQLGQSALMGTLGGLRSLAASYLMLESYLHFSNQDWDGNKRSLLMATYLEPTEESHWVSMVWNRGINATAWAEVHSDLPELERKLRFQEYALDALALGETGLKQLPKAVELRIQMAEVYKEKLKDMCGAARLYGDLMDLPGAPMFAKRFYGYYLADCPGKEREAYDHLIKLYHEGERNHLPSLIKNILILQEQLEIPFPLRIPEADPDEWGRMQALRKKKKRTLRLLPGGLRIP